VEVDIGNQRDMNPLSDSSNRPGRFFVDDGDPDNFAACLFKTPNLTNRPWNVPCVGLCHRLNGDRRISSNPH